MLTTLDHVLVLVRDLEASAETCSKVLGLHPSWRGGHPGLGTANALFRLGNAYIELISPEGEGMFADALLKRLDEEGEGPFGLAFGTDDAEECAAALRARDIAASDPVPGEGEDRVTGAKRSWRNVMIPEAASRGVFMFAIEHLSPPEALPLAEPTGGASAAVTGVDHVVINTPDPEAAIALYGDRLGLRLALDRSFDERGVRLLFFRISGITVEVAARVGQPASDPGVDRFWGIAYKCDDLDAAHRRATAAGLDVTDIRPGNKPGTRVCTVRGNPCGVPTLLISPD